MHKGRRASRRRSWKLSDFITLAGLAALLPFAWALPEPLWSPLWRGAARIPLLTSRRAARRTGKSIRAALGAIDPQTAEGIARDLKAAIYEMRMQDLRAWRPGGWQPRMVLEGEAHLQAALAKGKGAILWLAPFVFNNGPTKILLHRKGYRVSHLSSPQHGFSDTEFGVAYVNRIRCIPEERHLVQRIVYDRASPSTAMRRMMRALKDGEIVSIVASGTEGTEMVKGPVFGGRLSVAVGAPRLAGLTGAPLLPAFTVRDPQAGFRIVIEPPIDQRSDLPTDARVAEAIAEFLRRSEPWVRRYPGQWRAWSKWKRPPRPDSAATA
ncbi:MAG TPA: lysophospholipid acyltransferase family protein [Alphaproteobacteria bacterium]|nr:lysophospholipid acyltransferase family protein [Alphaproteobacteria bacterium]